MTHIIYKDYILCGVPDHGNRIQFYVYKHIKETKELHNYFRHLCETCVILAMACEECTP